jgi:hypothetical protein
MAIPENVSRKILLRMIAIYVKSTGFEAREGQWTAVRKGEAQRLYR